MFKTRDSSNLIFKINIYGYIFVIHISVISYIAQYREYVIIIIYPLVYFDAYC